MEFRLGEVLSRMWKVSWSNKRLWGIQILSLLFSLFIFLGSPTFTNHLPDFLQQILNKSIMIIPYPILSRLLLLPFFFAGIFSQTVTTYDLLRVENEKKKLTAGELFSKSRPYFWRIFCLYFIFGTIWILLMTLFTTTNNPNTSFWTLCFSLLLLFLAPTIGFSVLELAQAAIIAGNIGVLKAISHGWKLFRHNILNVFFLMIILYLGASFFLSITTFPIIIPLAVLASKANTSENLNQLISESFSFTILPITALLSIIHGVMIVFFQSAWTITFLRLNKYSKTPVVIEIN